METDIIEIRTEYKEIINNIEKYINIFIEKKILAFRELRATEEQGLNILQIMGNYLMWFPNFNFPNTHRYEEDHRYSLMEKQDIGNDEILVDWHLEHCSSAHPQCAAAWNMINFKCSSDSGNTGFIDSEDLYAQMPKDWKAFLQDCTILDQLNDKSDNSFISDDGYSYKSTPRNAVTNHPLTNRKIIRINTFEVPTTLLKYKEKPVSKGQQEMLDEICSWYRQTIQRQGCRSFWWNWSEGDLIIPDLSSLIHCVKGGFSFGERKFIGYWAYSNSYQKYFPELQNKSN